MVGSPKTAGPEVTDRTGPMPGSGGPWSVGTWAPAHARRRSMWARDITLIECPWRAPKGVRHFWS